MHALAAAIQPLRMQHIVHLRRARLLSGRPTPAFGERIRIGAPAFETRTMTGSECGHLIEKEQFGVAVAPDPCDGDV